MPEPDYTALAVFAALNIAAATTGALFRPGPWYQKLRKPSWTPPNWMFPIVWTVLYCAIAIAGWVVWERAGLNAWLALGVYGVSIVLNGAWSPLFFGLKRMDLAFADVALLWLSVAATILLFAPISVPASLMLAPYLVWVSVAAALNWRVMRLNPEEVPARARL